MQIESESPEAYARQTIATTNGRALAAANWRAIAYSFGCFGWLVAIKIGLWLLPFELAGLYLGTLVGVGKACEQQPKGQGVTFNVNAPAPASESPRQSRERVATELEALGPYNG